MTLLLVIRYVLSKENKRRDKEQLDDSYDDVYIERVGKDGQVERVKVDKVSCSLFFLLRFVTMFRDVIMMRITVFFYRNFWILQISRIAILDMFCKCKRRNFMRTPWFYGY